MGWHEGMRWWTEPGQGGPPAPPQITLASAECGMHASTRATKVPVRMVDRHSLPRVVGPDWQTCIIRAAKCGGTLNLPVRLPGSPLGPSQRGSSAVVSRSRGQV